MLRPETKSEIEGRVKAINLTLRQMALRAGVAFTTAYRGPRRLRTHRKLTDELLAEELRLLRHLQAIHGSVPAADPDTLAHADTERRIV